MLVFIVLLLLLLPSHMVCKNHIVQCRMWYPEPLFHKYYQAGDLILGGLVSQTFFGSFPKAFSEPPLEKLSEMFCVMTENYQHILTFAFAIKEINENPQIVPNMTLGLSIYDTQVHAKWSYLAAMQLISPRNRFVPNYKRNIHNHLTVVIEDLNLDTFYQIPNLLGIYKIPQLLYGSVPVMTDNTQVFPFHQMVPNDLHQYLGIIQLLLHFKWTWIGFFVARGVDLEWFVKSVAQLFYQYGICFAFIESHTELYHENEAEHRMKYWLKMYEHVMSSKANVFVFHGDVSSMAVLRWLLSLEKISDTIHKPNGKVWILTAQMELKHYASKELWKEDIQYFQGVLSFAMNSKELPGFQEFLQSRNPASAKEDGFIKDFWAYAFGCSFPNSVLGNMNGDNCTGEEKLETLPEHVFPMTVTGQSYSIYNAVYAVAHALHAIYSSEMKMKGLTEGEKNIIHNQQFWQLHHFLRRVSFNNSAGEEISFDQNGALVTGFDVLNWLTFPNQSFIRRKVGRMDPQAPPDQAFTINKDAIVWHSCFNQAQPLSVCNEHCHPGTRKNKKEGEPFCCYDCIPCPYGKISDQNDMNDCSHCQEDHYPNTDQNVCIPKTISFLSYEEPLGLSLAIIALSFASVTVLVFGIFIKNHNTPIVKANNQNVTYTLLLSLLLCFLSALFFIGRPEKLMCLIRQTAFGYTFSVAVSCVFAKTTTVVLAFKASKPGSRIRKWVGKRLAISIVVSCSLVQIGISTFFLATSPPFVNIDVHSMPEEIVLECTEGSTTMLLFGFGYMGSLALTSFTVAFLARKLPDTFNEAKCITFSMLLFCSIWLSFVPTYLSTKGKYVVAVHIFSMLASTVGLLTFMFLPKCYIIVLRPKLNNKGQLMKRPTFK